MKHTKTSSKILAWFGLGVAFLSILLVLGWNRGQVVAIATESYNWSCTGKGASRKVTDEVNSSVRYACDNQNTTRGVMWISSWGSDDGKYHSSGKNKSTSVRAVAKVDNWNDDGATIYLHGASFGGKSNASHIQFIKLKRGDPPLVNGQIKGSTEGYTTYPPLEKLPKTMERFENEWDAAPIISYVVPFTMPIKGKKGILTTEGSNCTPPTYEDDGDYRYCQVELHAFRCPEGISPYSTACYSDESTLKVHVKVVNLEGISRDVNGKLLEEDPEPDTDIWPGGTGTVEWQDIDGYTFVGWSKKTTGREVEHSRVRYREENMEQNVRVYAVYEKVQSYTLTGKPVDEAGHLLDLPEVQKDTKNKGKTAFVNFSTKGSLNGVEYEFDHYADAPRNGNTIKSTPDVRTKYVVYNIDKDVTVYAVYKKKAAPATYTLTGIPVLSKPGVNGYTPLYYEGFTDSKVSEISSGSSGSFTRCLKYTDNNPNKVCIAPGISGKKYRLVYFERKSDGARTTAPSNKYTEKNMTKDVDVYVVYEQVTDLTIVPLCEFEDRTRKLGASKKTVTYTAGKEITLSNNTIDAPANATGWLGWTDLLNGSNLNKSSRYKITVRNDTNAYPVFAVYSCTRSSCNGVIPTPPSYVNSDEYEGTTSTGSVVINDRTGAKSSNNEQPVYAMPTDEVSWCHAYFPGVQWVANQDVTPRINPHRDHMNIRTCDKFSSSCSSPESMVLGNRHLSRLVSWSNNYRIIGSNVSSGGSVSFETGDYEVRQSEYKHEVGFYDVSKTLMQTIETGTPTWAKRTVLETGPQTWKCGWAATGREEVSGYNRYKRTCYKNEDGSSGGCGSWSLCSWCSSERVCEKKEDGSEGRCVITEVKSEPIYSPTYGWSRTCKHDEPLISYEVNYSTASSFARVIVPYNYRNEVKLDDVDVKKTPFFAGESATVKSSIFVLPKDNGLSRSTYATIEGNNVAKTKIRVCANGSCWDTNEKKINGRLNSSGNLEGSGSVKEREEETTFNIPDLPAGTLLSIQSMLYPVDSGADDNVLPDPFGGATYNDDNWAKSEPVLVRVAKRPVMQVLGGNVYSAGGINMHLTQKKLLSGYNMRGGNIIDPNYGGLGNYVFGSYGELGVISWGTVEGFASGASLGYKNGGNGRLEPDPAGIGSFANKRGEGNICKLSPLTFDNDCRNGSVSGKGNAVQLTDGLTGDSEALNGLINSDATNVKKISTSQVGEVNPTDGNGEITVYYSNGDLIINGDIRTWDGMTYESFTKIPRVVIVAKGGNIRINCDVERIDAVLMAEGEVETCYTGRDDGAEDDPYDDDINTEAHSHRLLVNGAIIAKKLIANRTYGGATGDNTIVPAEIINFDPTLYSWGGNEAEKDSGGSSSGGNEDILNSDMSTMYIKELAPRL